MFLAVMAPLRLAHHIARGWIGLIMAVVALVYFAGADFLYLARLGAYASLAEDDSHPSEAPQEVRQNEPLLPTDIAPNGEPA